MNWDQIENKWAAMTQRIRADWKVSPNRISAQSAMTKPTPKDRVPITSPVVARNTKPKDGSPPASR